MVFILLLISMASANEVDNFTGRAAPLQDASRRINAMIEEKIRLAIEVYERTPRSELNQCDREGLMGYLSFMLDTHWPEIRYDIMKDGTIQKTTLLDVKDTIFKTGDFPLAMRSVGCCEPVVNVGGNRVGLDKIDHFFGQGFLYYRIYKDTKSLDAVLHEGVLRENGYMGLVVDGVKSYGDLASNFAGLYFWLDLFGEEGPDSGPYFKKRGPYIVCDGGRFKLSAASKIKISYYADADWDESINCNSFGTEQNARLVEKEIRRVSGGKNCPLEQSTCERLKQKYSPAVAAKILHPACIDRQDQRWVESVIHDVGKNAQIILEGSDGIIKELLFKPEIVNPPAVKAAKR